VVRFRLGGSKFPPTIYYKIFIHNPVQDINSYAPRDYSYEKAVKTHMKKFNINPHSKDGNAILTDINKPHDGW